MSAVLGVIAAVYLVSLAIAAGVALLMLVSPRFRRLLMGDVSNP